MEALVTRFRKKTPTTPDRRTDGRRTTNEIQEEQRATRKNEMGNEEEEWNVESLSNVLLI